MGDPKIHIHHPHLDSPRPSVYGARLTRASVLEAMRAAVREMGGNHVYPFDEVQYFADDGVPEHILGSVLLAHGYNKGMLGDLNHYASFDQVLALIPGGWNDRVLLEALCNAQDRHDGTIPANRWMWGFILEQFETDLAEIGLRLRGPEPPLPLWVAPWWRAWHFCAVKGCWTWTRFVCMRCHDSLCVRHRTNPVAHGYKDCPIPAE